MVKVKILVIEKREQSVNCTRDLKLYYTDAYLDKNDISAISRQHKNKIDTKWWEEDVESFVKKDNANLYAIYMKSDFKLTNAVLTDEELKKLTSD